MAKGIWQPVLSDPLTSQWDPSLKGRVPHGHYVLPHPIRFPKNTSKPVFPVIQFEDESGNLGMNPWRSRQGSGSVRCRQAGQLVEVPKLANEVSKTVALILEVRAEYDECSVHWSQFV